MKSEAVNSFNDGLVKDMNELNTPDKVLTDCLNGTLITYNGNELSLQNDMGNARVGTSYLNPGYIPVGMKEYGGIIYVASYNPKTKVGQIGSFPSPQQLYGDEKDGYELKIFIDDFVRIDESSNIPIIFNEFKRIPIFEDEVTDEIVAYKEFHPGDKFIISGKVSETILKAIDDGVIRLRLASVSNSGEIEYIDNSKLKTYDHSYNGGKNIVKLWIYPSDEDNISTMLRNNPDKIQIYAAKNSGRLLVVIEFSLFDNFSLYREYSYNELEDKYMVKFTGKATGNLESKYIYDEGSNDIKTELFFTSSKEGEKYSSVSYSILPIHYIEGNDAFSYGALERLRKKGIIDIDSLRKNKDSLGSWSYYVGDTTLTIDWSYDYFDVNQREIESMRFQFIPLNGIDILNKYSKEESSTINIDTIRTAIDKYEGINIPISEPSYNGDFETIIPIGGNNQLKKDYIYVCRADKKYVGEDEWKRGIFYKFVYTSTFFNTFTSEDIAGFVNNRPVVEIEVNGKFETTSTATSTKYYRNSNWIDGAEYATFEPLQSTFFIISPDKNSNYSFTTAIHRGYDLKIKATAEFGNCSRNGEVYSLSEFSGYPSSTYLNGYFESITPGETDYPERDYSNPSLSSHLNNIENRFYMTEDGSITSTEEGASTTFVYKTSTSRGIYASSGEVSSKSVQTEMLLPVYDPNNTNESVLNFWYNNSMLVSASGDEDHIRYGATTSGTNTFGGTDAPTGGHDDVDLSSAMNMMGDGVVGIFAGQNGDKASLKYENLGNSNHGWYHKDNEVDEYDNFLLATWKTVSGNHIIINMGTQKNATLRLDKRIKAILSQLLIAKRTTMNISGIGPNSNNYTYHLPFNSNTLFTVNVNDEKDSIKFYLDSNDESSGYDIETLLGGWTSVMGSDIENYLPVFSKKSKSYNVTAQFGSDIKIDENPNIISYYLNAYSTNISANGFSMQMSNGSDMKYDPTDIVNEAHLRKYIFIAQVSSVGKDGVCILAKNPDGSPEVKCIAGSSTKVPEVQLNTGDPAGNIYPCNINKYFCTLVKNNNLYNSPIEVTNRMLVYNSGNSRIGTWTKKAKGHAPDLYYNIHFGDALIGNYS